MANEAIQMIGSPKSPNKLSCQRFAAFVTCSCGCCACGPWSASICQLGALPRRRDLRTFWWWLDDFLLVDIAIGMNVLLKRLIL